MDLPPVPSPLVKSPPCSMKSLITLWNLLPLYPSPASSLLASCTKFSTVLGTVLPNRPISILPAASPSMVMSNQTLWVTLGPFLASRLHASRRTPTQESSHFMFTSTLSRSEGRLICSLVEVNQANY